MEAANGVEVELGNGVSEKDPTSIELNSNVNKENEIISIDTEGVPKDLSLKTGVGSEGTTSVDPETNMSTFPKKSGSSKAQKEERGRNVKAGVTKNPRAGLSQSLSFPARGTLASALRKSTVIVKQAKGDAKNTQSNGLEVSNGGAGARLTAATRKSLPVKFGLGDNGVPSKPVKSNNGDMKPLQQAVPTKQDDDAISTTSSTTPRTAAHRKSTGFVFSFRLDERAEKRKEFFLKVEEKIHAKELERTNLQEKSKESQEAEIRRLRKSLTFKATPMPCFYQEPGPPKVELKKIPTTRARSPKLGRHKPSTAVSNNPSAGSVPSTITNPSKLNGGASNGNGSSVALKKPTQKSLSNVPSQKSTTIKPEAKPLSSKPKVSNQMQKRDKPKVEAVSSKEAVESNETIINTVEPEAVPSEVDEVAVVVAEVPSRVIEVSVED